MNMSFALLIVDDDPLIANVVQALIKKRFPQSRVDSATTGAEALTRMSEHGYDLVLLDLNLPDIHGFDLFNELRTCNYQGPIAFLSGQSNAEVAARAFRLGAADYIVKSGLFYESVSNVVTRSLEMERLRREKAHAEAQRESLIQGLQTANAALEEKICALETTQAQLIQSEKMAIVGTLAAGVAHEINNPLSFVRGNLNIIETLTRDIASLLPRWYEAAPMFAGSVDADLRNFYDDLMQNAARLQLPLMMEHLEPVLSAVHEGVDRAARIVGDLLQFSGLERAEARQADLVAELERALNLVHGELKHRATIVRDLQPLPPIACRPRRLGQVFVNLLINAAQSIGEHGTITVRTRVHPDDVRLSVSDTGAGIAEDQLARIFDPFFTTKTHGAGLGLSVSDAIVRSHGGRIQVESQPEKGSTFTIILPRTGMTGALPQPLGPAVASLPPVRATDGHETQSAWRRKRPVAALEAAPS